MHAIADTETLVMDGVITLDQAGEIEARARQTMVALAINAVLTAGIIAATFGLSSGSPIRSRSRYSGS